MHNREFNRLGTGTSNYFNSLSDKAADYATAAVNKGTVLAWKMGKEFIHTMDLLMESMMSIDKIKVALFVTLLWARAGLFVAKGFEIFFSLLLSMPDKWLAFPISEVKNTEGRSVTVLSARTDTADITNKLRLFMKFYWENGGPEQATEHNGFDFNILAKMLNCSVMYCCYLLSDVGENRNENINSNINTNISKMQSSAKSNVHTYVHPDEFWKRINSFLVERTENGDCYKSTKPDLSDRTKLWLNNLSFETNTAVTPASLLTTSTTLPNSFDVNNLNTGQAQLTKLNPLTEKYPNVRSPRTGLLASNTGNIANLKGGIGSEPVTSTDTYTNTSSEIDELDAYIRSTIPVKPY